MNSGDPVEWGEKNVAHYRKLGIDPVRQDFIVSDSLDFARAHELYEHFRNRTKGGFWNWHLYLEMIRRYRH